MIKIEKAISVVLILFSAFVFTMPVSGTSSRTAAVPDEHRASSPSRPSALQIASVSGPAKFFSNDEMADGSHFVEHMISAADSYSDYSFDYQMTVYKGAKQVIESGNFYFKRPKLMKLEVTQGKRDGAVAILGMDGKVKAKVKGLGFLPTFSLSPDSGLLRSANGYPMVDSDFHSLAQALKKFISEGMSSKVTRSALQLGTQSTSVYVLEMYRSDAQLFKRVFVDADKYLPVEWYDYEDGKLWSLSTWHNFKGNLGLSDKFFTVKGES